MGYAAFPRRARERALRALADAKLSRAKNSFLLALALRSICSAVSVSPAASASAITSTLNRASAAAVAGAMFVRPFAAQAKPAIRARAWRCSGDNKEHDPFVPAQAPVRQSVDAGSCFDLGRWSGPISVCREDFTRF